MQVSYIWSDFTYSDAVDFAEKLGMRFATVDLTVKVGSSWWLFRPRELGDFYELLCPLPGDNYTEEGTVLLYIVYVQWPRRSCVHAF